MGLFYTQYRSWKEGVDNNLVPRAEKIQNALDPKVHELFYEKLGRSPSHVAIFVEKDGVKLLPVIIRFSDNGEQSLSLLLKDSVSAGNTEFRAFNKESDSTQTNATFHVHPYIRSDIIDDFPPTAITVVVDGENIEFSGPTEGQTDRWSEKGHLIPIEYYDYGRETPQFKLNFTNGLAEILTDMDSHLLDNIELLVNIPENN